MVISHLPYGPTAYFGLYNVVLRHDIQTKETISQQYPHLIFDNFTTKLGERVYFIYFFFIIITFLGTKYFKIFISSS